MLRLPEWSDVPPPHMYSLEDVLYRSCGTRTFLGEEFAVWPSYRIGFVCTVALGATSCADAYELRPHAWPDPTVSLATRSALAGRVLTLETLPSPDDALRGRRTLPRNSKFSVAYLIQSADGTFRSNLDFFMSATTDSVRDLFLLSYGEEPVPFALHFPRSTVAGSGRQAERSC